MKHFTIIFIILFQFVLFSFSSAKELINIDFTRDSTNWKTAFPEPSWNSLQTEFTSTVENQTIDSYNFNGLFGTFNPGVGSMAQPINIENNSQRRKWAFRITNATTSHIELPELTGIGRFTVFCKNSNGANEANFKIQKLQGDNWVDLHTFYIPPHYNQNFEMQMEKFLNINEPVKLRIAGANRNIHIYAVRAESFVEAEPREKPLRLILLPDQQSYANQSHLNHIYGIQSFWINKHADSISFVINQGDMTQLNNSAQWSIAGGALGLLEGRNIPFTFCAGNHDLGRHADVRNTNMMNAYLPYNRYSRHPWFGGTQENNKVDNTYHTFTWRNYKFLILSLEFGPRNKVLDWANTIIEQYPQHNVIINTHAYMFQDNTIIGSNPNHPGQPRSYGIGSDTGDEYPNNGFEMWNKLVKKHPNCLFVFSGHVTGKGIGELVSQGDQGNKVYQFLANYQGGVDGSQDMRNGMLRIVDLDPEHGSFSIKTYSPYTDQLHPDAEQHIQYQNVNFIPYEPNATNNVDNDDIRLIVQNKKIHITNKKGEKTQLSVYDIKGSTVKQKTFTHQAQVQLPDTGYYVIKIHQKGSNNAIHRKIMIL